MSETSDAWAAVSAEVTLADKRLLFRYQAFPQGRIS